MKKIMKRKGTDVESYISGYSLEYGILLRAQTTGNDGINFFENMYPGAFATIDDSGNVKIMHEEQFKLSDKQKEKELKDKKAIKRLENALFFAGVIFLLLVIPAVMLSSNIGIFCVGMSFICFGLKNVATIIYQYILRSMGDKRTIQTHRFHAAEHAVVNAYYDLNRVPTLDEIKNYSYYSYYCGTINIFMDAWPNLIVGFCRFFPGNWFFVPLVFAISIFAWAVKKQKLFFVEYFTLYEPTEKEYKVVIAALSGALEYKSRVDDVRDTINIFKGIVPWQM